MSVIIEAEYPTMACRGNQSCEIFYSPQGVGLVVHRKDRFDVVLLEEIYRVCRPEIANEETGYNFGYRRSRNDRDIGHDCKNSVGDVESGSLWILYGSGVV